jgi:tetratricopeptide (TPR) repeat protein
MSSQIQSFRYRWLVMVAVWIALTALVFSHARLIRDYLGVASELGLRGEAAPSTPLAQPYPAFAADAQTWVRHALTLSEGRQSRLRFTDIDNAPDGREVHWNSAWGWIIALGGKLEHWANNTPLPRATERMALWVNPFVLTVLFILLSAWAVRRAGLVAGVLLAAAIVGHPRIYEGFFPSYVDHHGILTLSVLGMFLGALFMGAGWWRSEGAWRPFLPDSPEVARRGAVSSAVCGALGMWVSAASVLPSIAVVGVSGFIIVLTLGRRAIAAGERFDPEVWRTWGRVGGGLSFFFYLVEYFPNHLGLRLEANHPFYSAAWWAAGELMARVSGFWIQPAGRRWKWDGLLWIHIAAVLLAPATIIIGGSKVFVVSDPFLSDLHKFYIQEFLPLWVPLKGIGWSGIAGVVFLENLPLWIGVLAVAFAWRRLPVSVFFAVLAILLLTAMAWVQARWLLNSSACQVALGLMFVSVGISRLPARWRGVATAALGILFFLPQPYLRLAAAKHDVAARRVSPKDANSALARDVARVIRASQPEGDIVVLSSPNSSTAIGYYGRFKTLGTLYWENNAGLKAAGAILSASSAEEAAALVKKYRVTHIVMISEENFVEPYFRLLKPSKNAEDFKQSFGFQLLFAKVIPTWLQMIPYKVPDDLAPLNVSALLFKVAFNQTPADALYHIALTKIALGNLAGAEEDFDTLIKGSPDSFQPYTRKAELQVARGEHLAAAKSISGAIGVAPLGTHLELASAFGGTFFRGKRHAAAAMVYEAALARQFNGQIASYLAFVLAVSSDDSVRNPTRSLEWAQKAAQSEPESVTSLNTVAVALAANGRFPEAVGFAERALAIAKASNQAQGVKVTEARLQSFRAGKPWRE